MPLDQDDADTELKLSDKTKQEPESRQSKNQERLIGGESEKNEVVKYEPVANKEETPKTFRRKLKVVLRK